MEERYRPPLLVNTGQKLILLLTEGTAGQSRRGGGRFLTKTSAFCLVHTRKKSDKWHRAASTVGPRKEQTGLQGSMISKKKVRGHQWIKIHAIVVPTAIVVPPKVHTTKTPAIAGVTLASMYQNPY